MARLWGVAARVVHLQHDRLNDIAADPAATLADLIHMHRIMKPPPVPDLCVSR